MCRYLVPLVLILFAAFANAGFVVNYSITTTQGNSSCGNGSATTTIKDTNLYNVATKVAAFANGRLCPGFGVSATGLNTTTGAFSLTCATVSSQCANQNLTAAPACPANSTLSGGICTCSTGYSQTASSICIANGSLNACTSTAQVSAGYYDFGASADGPPGIVCSSGCLAIFDGTNQGGSKLVNGVRHYFGHGSYTYMGGGSTDNCASGDGTTAISSSSGTLPSDTCASGQGMTTVDGVNKCYDVQGKEVASAKDPNAQGTQQAIYCAANPTASMCQITDPGTGHTVASSSFYTLGSATFADKVAAIKSTVQSSGWYSAVSTFFSVSTSAGTCSLDGTFSMYGSTVPFSVDAVMSPTGTVGSLVFPAMKYMFWAACAWLAFVIAFL